MSASTWSLTHCATTSNTFPLSGPLFHHMWKSSSDYMIPRISFSSEMLLFIGRCYLAAEPTGPRAPQSSLVMSHERSISSVYSHSNLPVRLFSYNHMQCVLLFTWYFTLIWIISFIYHKRKFHIPITVGKSYHLPKNSGKWMESKMMFIFCCLLKFLILRSNVSLRQRVVSKCYSGVKGRPAPSWSCLHQKTSKNFKSYH